MRNIRVTALMHINLNDMTEIWNRCWRGYYYDMSYSPWHMRAWLDLSQVCLQHSLAILVDDQIAGFALLSIDAADGWIAGTGIDPKFRRQGLFTTLMRIELDVARHAGLRRVYLEVLEQNFARKVYQSVGFAQIRELSIYRIKNIDILNRPDRIRPFELIPIDRYFENRRALFKPAWQRREGYLRRHLNISAVMNSTGSAGALFAGDKTALVIDAWSTTDAGAKEVISAINQRSGASWSLINQPEDQIVTLLKGRGIYPTAKQYEMCIELT